MHIDIQTVQEFYKFVAIFFLLYLIVYSTFLFLSVSVGSVSLYEQRRRKRLYNYLTHDYYMPVSIIIPAYNEDKTVVDTVKSLLDLEYRLFEIIVVDDGSTDNTSQVMIDTFSMQLIDRPIRKKVYCNKEQFIFTAQIKNVKITLIRKANGGKGDALNMGINVSEFPYFVCIDADCMLQYDALTNIVRPLLEDSSIVAVGGLVRINNDVVIENGHVTSYKMPRNILLSLQIIEYDRSFLASRLLFDKFNGNLIISGAFGLFKKDVVIAAGGYDTDTMGEDMEIVVRIHSYCRSNHIPYKIKYASDAVCWSQAPAKFKDLNTQRRRWHLGLFQSIIKHRTMLFNPAYGIVSFVSFFYFVMYELLSPYIEIFGILTMIIAGWYNLINVPFMITFILMYAIFGGILTVTAFFSRIHAMDIKLRMRDVVKAILLCLVENMGLRFVLVYIRLFSFVGYSKKKRDWGEIERYKMTEGESE